MTAIFISILLFGFIHPGSKVLLDSGIPLSYFCVAYVGVRLIVQIGIAFLNPSQLKVSKNLIIGLGLFGLIGAGLQYFEFKGIDKGLSPGTVTFIMFSYPLWLALIKLVNNPLRNGIIGLVPALLSGLGILLVTKGSLVEIQSQIATIFYPLIASLFIALWILQSTRLRVRGIQTLTLSIYYDLFSLLVLLTLLQNQLASEYSSFVTWIDFKNLILMSAYSILAGLVPNFLFYYGSRSVEPQVSGLAMSFEPVLSTLYSAIFWQYSFGIYFWTGASLILLANVPLQLIKLKLRAYPILLSVVSRLRKYKVKTRTEQRLRVLVKSHCKKSSPQYGQDSLLDSEKPL